MRNNSLDCMPLFVVLVTAFLATAVAVADDNGRTAADQEVDLGRSGLSAFD